MKLIPKHGIERPIAILVCPCCDRRKKPFLNFRSLNNHLTKHHSDYPYKIYLSKTGRHAGKIVQRKKP